MERIYLSGPVAVREPMSAEERAEIEKWVQTKPSTGWRHACVEQASMWVHFCVMGHAHMPTCTCRMHSGCGMHACSEPSTMPMMIKPQQYPYLHCTSAP